MAPHSKLPPVNVPPVETRDLFAPGWLEKQLDNTAKMIAAMRPEDRPRLTGERAGTKIRPGQGGEVRMVDPETGGEKGQKPDRFDLIPVGPLRKLAALYGIGAKKYAPSNWRKSYAWSLSYRALQNHANQFWAGEDLDEETGLPHLAAVVFHAFALMEFMETARNKDDRYKSPGNPHLGGQGYIPNNIPIDYSEY